MPVTYEEFIHNKELVNNDADDNELEQMKDCDVNGTTKFTVKIAEGEDDEEACVALRYYNLLYYYYQIIRF
mgnify:CR=1 FL=1